MNYIVSTENFLEDQDKSNFFDKTLFYLEFYIQELVKSCRQIPQLFYLKVGDFQEVQNKLGTHYCWESYRDNQNSMNKIICSGEPLIDNGFQDQYLLPIPLQIRSPLNIRCFFK